MPPSKVLVQLRPLAMEADSHLIRSMDLAETRHGARAASLLFRRLSTFGFTDIVASIEIVEPSWSDADEMQKTREQAAAFLDTEKIPYFFTERPGAPFDDPLAHSAKIYQNLPGSDDETYLVASMRSLFIPKEEIEALFILLRGSDALAAARDTWEGLFAAKKSYFRESAVKSIWGSSKVVRTTPPYALPVAHPAFDFNLEFRPLLDKLTSPPEQWSYQDLEGLKKKEPGLFRSLPAHVGIELTNEDNLPRLRNPQKLSKRSTGFLSDENWKMLIAELPVDRKRVSIDFWDFGEPLLHPHALDFIFEAAQKGIRVDLYTNGLLLNEEKSRQLLESGADAVFYRLDAMSAETYGKVNGNPEAYTVALRNLERLAALKKERNRGEPGWPAWRPIIAAQITEMPETAGDVDAFYARFDGRGRVQAQLRAVLGRPPHESEIVTALYEQTEPIEHAMLRHDNLFRGRVQRSDNQDMSPLLRFPCRQLSEGLYVTWNGDILPCREDVEAEHVIGTVQDGLLSAWQGAKMAAFFQLHDEGQWNRSALCGPCKEWYYGFS